MTTYATWGTGLSEHGLTIVSWKPSVLFFQENIRSISAYTTRTLSQFSFPHSRRSTNLKPSESTQIRISLTLTWLQKLRLEPRLRNWQEGHSESECCWKEKNTTWKVPEGFYFRYTIIIFLRATSQRTFSLDLGQVVLDHIPKDAP